MAKSKQTSKKGITDQDLALALELEQAYNPVGVTENAVFPEDKNKENYRPRTLIDQTLEIIDPTPNIYTLFMQFNTRFFWNHLLPVEVKWSPRMTSCAGICTFHPRNRQCVISLSAPLLKLRPRKDLVETLLHEMIHGYLFLTNNNRDRDGHGPEFCKHMDRINKEAGTAISIYHSFHDEVKLYQQHWWRCNGPCQQRAPYFGMVRRAMNRAPGPSDCWWTRHQQNCGGDFIKVREPENFKSKGKSQKNGDEKKKPVKNTTKGTKTDKSLDDFFAKPQGKPKPTMTKAINGSLVPAVKPKSNGSGLNDYNPLRNISPTSSSANPATPAGLVKLGTSTNRVHGFGTGGPGSSSKSPKGSGKANAPAGLVKLGTNTNRVHGFGTGGPGSSSGSSPNVSNNKGGVKPTWTVNASGTLGGVGTGRSNLLDKYSPSASPGKPNNRPAKKSAAIIIVDDDTPPAKKPKIVESADSPVLRLNDPNAEELFNCPVCDLSLPNSRLNAHLDICLAGGSKETKNTETAFKNKKSSRVSSSSSGSPKTPSPIKGQTNLDKFVISPKTTATKHYPCPVCNKSLDMNLLNEHLDKCLAEPRDTDKEEKKKNSVLRIEGPPAGRSKTFSSNDVIDLTNDIAGTGEPYVCLVCNEKIRGDIALNDHLDECVQNIFNADSSDSENESSFSKSLPVEAEVEDDRLPCPMCMELIAEKKMNQHLDACLSRQNWD